MLRDQVESRGSPQGIRGHGGDDSEQNLITLCVACHSLVHRGRKFLMG
jgi:hypothetical protein